MPSVFMLLSALSIGGSCAKSPQKMSCRPPHGASRYRGQPPSSLLSGDDLMLRSVASNQSQNSASIIETSSITSVRTVRQYFFSTHIFPKSPQLWGMPGPGFECIVWPPMRMAATPVGAITMTDAAPFFASRAPMILRSVNDLPVPGPPVRNTLLPPRERSTARCCIISSVASCIGSGASRVGAGDGGRCCCCCDDW
eukprot:5461798-Prymnesium_polylepis.2